MQFIIKRIIPTLIFFLVAIEQVSPQMYTVPDEKLQKDLIIGADISELKKVEDNGGIFRVNRVEKDALQLLKDHWFDYVRLNLFHTPSPSEANQGLDANLQMAKRSKKLGFKLLLDVHYSDTWANPGVQTKPQVWNGLSFETLKDSVYQYTRHIIRTFKEHDVLPDIVQLGNEITGGMLWDEGRVGGSFDTSSQWRQFAALIKEGIRGINDGLDPGQSVMVMIHLDSGGSAGTTQWFFDHLLARGVPFDIIGLSFYSYWGGRLDNLNENLKAISSKYGKDIYIVETSYPWTMDDYDQVPNWMSDPERLHPGYPASACGQRQFLEDVIAILDEVPDGRGKGIFYWQPIDISPPRWGSGAENIAMFDFQGILLPSIRAFAPAGVVQITINLNIASIPDTLGPDSFVEMRGALNGMAPYILADGNILDWSEYSDIELVHRQGDLFTATFYAPVGSELHCKFWSQDVLRSGMGNGWESGDSNGDEHGNTVVAVAGDTVLPVHFYNSSEIEKPYDWRPYEIGDSAVAVWFRAYLNTLEGMKDGYIAGNNNQLIGVRGDDLNGIGPLNWKDTRIILKRESSEEKMAGYHLYAGVAYYPTSLFGRSQRYKFFIEPNGWEEGNLTDDRSFVIPSSDTTLHWVYYGNSTPMTVGAPRLTLRLNAASIPDTIRTDAVFQVRGSVNGLAPFTLPDGHIIDWSDRSTLQLNNAGGDYFEISFAMPDDAELRFKFWSQDAERLGLNDGWETGDLGGDEYGNTVITVLTNTSLPLHFFNSSGEKKPYGWRPYASREDSIAVWFRVFMHTPEGVADGYNPDSGDQSIGIRGSNLMGWITTLDWGETNVRLHRETSDKGIPGFHLFSGVVYYPKLHVLHPQQEYKFVIDPDAWEEGNLIGNRKFDVPHQDTTLQWAYYGDTSSIPTGFSDAIAIDKIPEEPVLCHSYPNPFNSCTRIRYRLPYSIDVNLNIYNLLGQIVKTFRMRNQLAGLHDIIWDGKDTTGLSVPGGIYFYELRTDHFSAIMKLSLIR